VGAGARWLHSISGNIQRGYSCGQEICDMVVGLGALEILVCLDELAVWADDEEVDTGADFEGQGEEGGLWRFGIVFEEAW